MKHTFENDVESKVMDLTISGIFPDYLHAMKVVNTNNYDYNCWSLTANLLGLSEKIEWFYEYEMQNILSHYTCEVDQPDIGDIVSFTWSPTGELLHTAIVCDKIPKDFVIIHKDGEDPIRIEKLKSAIRETYLKDTNVRYHRITRR